LKRDAGRGIVAPRSPQGPTPLIRSSETGPLRSAETGPQALAATGQTLPDTLPETLPIALAALDDMKAEDTVLIDLKGKTSIADHMVITSGRSNRHVASIADEVVRLLKEAGHSSPRVEGVPHCDWVLIDAGDVVVHVFRPEVRQFYNLEKMWGADRPTEGTLAERAAG
jgi:ribosome-associated protein